MFTASDFVAGGVVPALVTAAVALIVGLARRGLRGKGAAWMIALAVGFVAGELALRAREFSGDAIRDAAFALSSPREAIDWIPAFVVASLASATAIVWARRRAVRIGGWCFYAGLGGLLTWRLLAGSKFLPSQELLDAGFTDGALSHVHAAAIMAAVGLAATAAAWPWASPRGDGGVRWALVRMGAVAFGASLLAALSGSFRFGLSLGALTACLGGLWLTTWGERGRPGGTPRGTILDLRAVAFPATMALAGLSVCGVAFAEVVWWRALLVALAWGVAADIWPASPGASRKKSALRSGLFLAPLGVALIAAGWDFAAAVRPQTEQPAAGGDPYWGK